MKVVGVLVLFAATCGEVVRDAARFVAKMPAEAKSYCALGLAVGVTAFVWVAEAKCNVAIPANIDVDQLGATVLGQMVTPVVTVLVLAVGLMAIVAMKRLIFRGGRKLMR